MKQFIVFVIILVTFGGVYNSPTIKYSLLGYFGDISYKKNALLDAKKHYEDVLFTHSGSTVLQADTLYNLGNTLYRIGESEKDDKRIEFYKKSIENYTKSLSIRIDRETEENLAFVQEKLKKEEEMKNQKKQEEQDKKRQEEKENKEQKTGSGGDKKPENSEKETESKEGKQEGEEGEESKNTDEKKNKTGTGNTNPQSGQNWSNQGSYNPIGGEKKNEKDMKLSEADKQEVQKYTEDLKKFGKENGRLLNPEKLNSVGSMSEQIRNFFGNDSFFQDVLPTNDGKKDW